MGKVLGAVVLCLTMLAMGDEPKKESLADAVAALKIPPDWFANTTPQWDMNKPWKEARIEVRRLLAMDDPQKVREAVKMTWLYAQKGDIGDGHELPMYLFMSGNYAWATLEYPKLLARTKGKGYTHEKVCYASCLAHFAEYQKAMVVLDEALTDLPAPPWRINATANVHNIYGDVYARMGNIEKAKAEYGEAMRLYPTSNQPAGQHVLTREMQKVRNKLDLLTIQSMDLSKLKDGKYDGRALAYSDKHDMFVTLTMSGGKIADIQLKHEEKIDLGATKTIPARIIEKQSLKVDIVTGATITSQAIIDASLVVLRQAGMK